MPLDRVDRGLSRVPSLCCRGPPLARASRMPNQAEASCDLARRGKQAMAEQVNLRIARQGWDAWNAHDVEGWLKIVDEKHVWETDRLPAPVNGRDAAGQTMRMYITAFPDLRFSVDQLLPSGSYVVTRC